MRALFLIASCILANTHLSASCDEGGWVRIDPAQERSSVNYRWVVSLSDGQVVADYTKPRRDAPEPAFEADMTSVLDPQYGLRATPTTSSWPTAGWSSSTMASSAAG